MLHVEYSQLITLAHVTHFVWVESHLTNLIY